MCHISGVSRPQLFSAGGSPNTYSSCKNMASLTGECLLREGEQDQDRFDTDDIDDFILQLTIQLKSFTAIEMVEDVKKYRTQF